MTLRDYQSSASDSIIQAWRSHQSCLLVLYTGGGKTIIFADVIKRRQPGRSLVIGHREELIFQAKEKIQKTTGLDCEVEMANFQASTNLFHRTPVVIATIQTLTSGGEKKRMERFDPADFSTVIVDECFPAKTLVSGTPIECLQIGDSIATHQGAGTVERIFRKQVDKLIRFTLSDGRSLTSTETHPIWSEGKFVAAKTLTEGSMVLTISDYDYLYNMSLRNFQRKEIVRKAQLQKRAQSEDNSCDICAAPRGNNQVQKKKRNARSGYQSQGLVEVACDGMEAHHSRRERTRPHDSRTSNSRSPWLANERYRQNEHDTGQWLPNPLQGGCWQLSFEDSGRDRWYVAQLPGTAGAGFQKGRTAAFVRVVRVEVFKRGDREQFARVCPDGFVYNLTVSNGNTYLANGVLVHNCHHATAESYRAALAHFSKNRNLKILGVTATPDRADREALGQVFQTVAANFEILDGIENGWLCDITQQFVPVKGLDYSHVRTTAGDLNGKDLAAVMEAERNIMGICQPSMEVLYGMTPHTLDNHPVPEWGQVLGSLGKEARRTIVFTASVKQAEACCNIFNRVIPAIAKWVCGETNKDERRNTLKEFAMGQVRVVCNCGVLTEGFDDPGVEVIIMARPTKSRTLYAQMIGRSTRTVPGLVDDPLLATALHRREAIKASVKPFCRVIDFVGNSGKHKLINCMDILGGKVTEQARNRAIAEALREKKPVRVLHSMTKAELEIEQERKKRQEEARRQAEARKAALLARSQFRTQDVNPFGRAAHDPKPAKVNGWRGGKRFSEKQATFLRRWCGKDPNQIPYGYGVRLIAEKCAQWDKQKGVAE